MSQKMSEISTQGVDADVTTLAVALRVWFAEARALLQNIQTVMVAYVEVEQCRTFTHSMGGDSSACLSINQQFVERAGELGRQKAAHAQQLIDVNQQADRVQIHMEKKYNADFAPLHVTMW